MQMMPSQAVYIKREKDEKNNESSGCRTNERSVSIYDGRRKNPGYISVAVMKMDNLRYFCMDFCRG